MQKLSTRPRALAPVLSHEHLYLARSAPASDAGTHSSGFITPPVAGPRSMIPPPRDESDDYLNLHGHRRHRRKQVGRQAWKLNNTREELGVSSSGLRTPASGTRSTGGRCESCGTSSNASDGDSVSDAPLIKNMNQLKLNTNMQDRQRTTGYASVHVPTWSTLNSSVNEARDVESPAMKALRTLRIRPCDECQVPSHPWISET